MNKNNIANTVTRRASGIFTIACLVLAILPAQAQVQPTITCDSDPNLFNTAYDGAGGFLPPGAIDMNWEVGDGTPAGPGSVSDWIPAFVVGQAVGGWTPSPFSNANWISYTDDGRHTVDVDRYYRYQFTLDDEVDLDAFRLSIDFYVDNSVWEVYVNGQAQSGILPPGTLPQEPDDPYFHPGFVEGNQASMTLTSNWQIGFNELIIHVKSAPGFEGLMAQITASPLCPGDWAVSKAVSTGGGHAQPGEVVTYTITVEHTGGDDLVGVSVEDDLSGILGSAVYNDDAAATSGGVGYSEPMLVWVGDLAAGQTVTITYSVTVDDPLTSGAEVQVFSGTAQAWTTDSTWQDNVAGNSPVLAINAPDGEGVQLWFNQSNSLALDLANVVPAGETVVLHLAAHVNAVFQGDVLIESSIDGAGYGNPITVTPTDILPAYGEYDYTVPAGGARFIRITPQDNGQNGTAVRVDAVTYAYEFLQRAGATNLVQQGSFEEFTQCSIQDGAMGAWTAVNVHIWGNNCNQGWVVPDGVNSVDLDGDSSVPGDLQQTITGLTPGEVYNLIFYMAFNPAAGADSASMRLTIADFDTIYTSASNATLGGFNRVHVEFTAQNASETLRFESLTGSGDPDLIGGGGVTGWGVVFDDVRITPQSDLVDIGDAQLVNAVTGSLNCPSPPVTDPDDLNFNPDCVTITPLAGIELFKTATPAQALPGTTVTYTFTAINTGSLPLTDVVISETGFSGTGAISALVCTPAQPAVLDPEDILECTATYVVQQDDVDAGVLVNTAQVVGVDPNANAITDVAEAQVQVLAPPPPASTCNLAANGSFEIPNIQTDPQRPGENTAFVNGWAVWRTTDYPIDGWETVNGTVDILRLYNNASDGMQSIDLWGTAAATFQQTFTGLVPGQEYTFSVDYSGLSAANSLADLLLDLGAGFQSIETLSPVANGVSNGNAGLPDTPQWTVVWDTFTHSFTATGTEATIRFVNHATPAANNTGLFIDNLVFGGEEPCEDFGDAPDSYGTLLANNGARHAVIGYDPAEHTALLMLGERVSIEADGQPGANADADDFDDGVDQPIVLVNGMATTVEVTVTNNTDDVATLVGWIDLGGTGSFDAGDRSNVVTVPANSGLTTHQLTFDPPTVLEDTYARFRVFPGSVADPQPTGPATAGEVEDYPVTGTEPEPFVCEDQRGYILFDNPTQVAGVDLVTGEWEILVNPLFAGQSNAWGYNVTDNMLWGYHLGQNRLVRVGADWQPEFFDIADLPVRQYNTGDVSADGVLYLYHGSGGTGPTVWIERVDVNPASATYLQRLDPVPLNPGRELSDWAFSPVDGMLYSKVGVNRNVLRIHPDTGAVTLAGTMTAGPNTHVGSIFMDAAGSMYLSANDDGGLWRVAAPHDDDVTVEFLATGPATGNNDGARCMNGPLNIDFGDAPDSYGTTLANDGARHGIPFYDEATNTAPLMLGTQLDPEFDGQPSPGADTDNFDDGVADPIVVVPGEPTTVTVTVTNNTDEPATLAGWIDLGRNGVFGLGAEREFITIPANSGTADYELTFPASANSGLTYARFRVFPGIVADPLPTGPASAGEVEDYRTALPEQPPWVCTLDGILSQGSNPTNMHFIDMITGDTVDGPVFTGRNLNALAYNPADGYLYAWDNTLLPNGDRTGIVRIGDDGSHHVLGMPNHAELNPAFSFPVGDIDGNGHYWVSNDTGGSATSRWFRIDLDSNSPTFMQVLDWGLVAGGELPAGTWVGSGDWAWVPGGGDNLWRVMVNNSNGNWRLWRFDMNTGQHHVAPLLPALNPQGITTFGAAYADDQFLYVSNNTSGDIFRVDIQAGTASHFTDGPPSGSNDGARCPIPIYTDYGDAPESYGTLLDDNGPRHGLHGYDPDDNTAFLMLGTNVSHETDGQPSAGADADTFDDGVDEPIVLVRGEPITVEVTVTNNTDEVATLAGWIDLDGTGAFDAGDRSNPVTVPANSGVTTHELTFDPGTTPFDTYARFRVFPGVVTDPMPIGPASSGEVEDYLVAGSPVPPLQTCPAEEIRASERWWYFGNNAGIDFDVAGTTATPFTHSQVTMEGSTVVTDTSGQLLFWSNGQTVFDRNSNPMPNGGGLLGDPSATQTVAAFPAINQPGTYFVVTTTAQVGTAPNGRLHYSVVDMSLNGGLGDVTTKNVELGLANTASEALSAVPNADGTGFWVLTYTNNSPNFLAYEFDDNGPVTGNAVVSVLPTSNFDRFGSININRDLDRLVTLTSLAGGNARVRLLIFDAISGQAAEEMSWLLPTGAGTGDTGYTADFSPDGDYVYASKIFGGGQLYRYRIADADSGDDVKDTEEHLGSTGTIGGQVRRGPDGRMYVASARTGNALSVVNAPDDPDDAGFVANGFPLAAGSTSDFGLPQTVTGCPLPSDPMDFGDAPESYGTLLADDGARHVILDYDVDTFTSSLMLGARIDAEFDGFPSAGADGDDLDNIDDEDAFSGAIALQPGATAVSLDVAVTNATGGDANLYAWIDFNGNGVFDAAEMGDCPIVAAGATQVTCTWAGLTPLLDGFETYARFRLTTQMLAAGTAPNGGDARAQGLAADGEVEDHPVTVATVLPLNCEEPFIETFGSYATAPGAFPGWGQPLPAGTTTYVFQPGSPAPASTVDAGQYAVMTSPRLSHLAWHDAPDHTGDVDGFMLVVNGDLAPGVFYRRTFSGLAVGARYTFFASLANVVAGFGLALPDVTLRIVDPETSTVLASFDTGGIPEDPPGAMTWHAQQLIFTATQAQVRVELANNSGAAGGNDVALDDIGFAQVCEFGDAPQSYGTLNADDGAGHVILDYDPDNFTSSLMLGSRIDAEPDGFPSAGADGDDNDNIDDEDAFNVMPPININLDEYTIEVPVHNATGADAVLVGWIDFNRNGQFDVDEAVTATVADGQTLATLSWTGLNLGGQFGSTYVRLRIAPEGEIDVDTPAGVAIGGEVEDYLVPFVDLPGPPFTECPVNEEPPPTDFSIQERWATAGTTTIAYQTPVVGDLYGNGQPVAVIGANDDLTGGTPQDGRLARNLHIYRGIDGQLLHTIDTPLYSWSSHGAVVIADVTGDGQGEIIFKVAGHTETMQIGGVPVVGRLIAYAYDDVADDWNVLWLSDARYDYGESRGGHAISVADFNGDGVPEVYVGNQIFNAATGERLAWATAGASAGCSISREHCFKGATVAADMDDDGQLELIAGNVVYKVDLDHPDPAQRLIVWQEADPSVTGVGDGYTSVADINLDGTPDVVVVHSPVPNESRMYVWSGQSDTVLGVTPAFNMPNPGNTGSQAMLGDIDGDGMAEIVFITANLLHAFKYEPGTGLVNKWSASTNDSSGETSLSMFDFNNNGRRELVYRDETDLRIMDGSGAAPVDLATFGCASGTGSEMPVIAALDGTREARILVTCGVGGILEGNLRAYETASFPWANTRPVWNQQAYFVAHINDDLSVPSNQFPHWTAFNDPGQQCSDGINRPLNAFQQQVTDLDPANGCPVVCVPPIVETTKELTGESGDIDGAAEPGELLTYTITLTNVGGVDAENWHIVDFLDPNVIFVSADMGGVHDGSPIGGTVEWEGLLVPADDFIELTITVQVVDPIPDGVLAIGNVAYSPAIEPEPDCDADDPPPNCVEIPTAPEVVDSKDLVAESGAIDGVAEAGEQLTYEITLVNFGGSDAEDYLQIDQLDPNVVFVSADNGGAHDGSATGGDVTWTVTVPAADENGPGMLVLTVVVEVVAPIPDGVLAIGNVTYNPDDGPPDCDVADPPPNCSDPLPTEPQVFDSKDLVAESGAVDGVAEAGEQLTYEITLINTGGTDAVNHVQIDQLDANVIFVSADNGGVHDGSATGGDVTWVVTVPAADDNGPGVLVLTVVVQVVDPIPAGVTEIGNVTYNPDDGPPDCDVIDPPPNCSDPLPTEPNVADSKDLVAESGAIDGVAEAGEQLTYEITLTNSGGSDAENYVQIDQLDANVMFVSADNGGVHDGAATGGEVEWTVTVPAADENGPGVLVLIVVVQVVDPIPAGVTEIGNVTYNPDDGPPDCDVIDPPPNCSDPLPTEPQVVDSKDLVAESGDIDGVAEAGEELTYEITLTNTGGTDAENYVQIDQLDANVVFVSADNGGVHDGSATGGDVTWMVTVPADSVLVLTVVVQVVDPIPAGVTEIGNVTYNPDNGPPDCDVIDPPPNCSDPLPTEPNVADSKDLVAESGAIDGVAEAGEELTYEITLTNTGGTDAEDRVQIDQLDPNVVFVSADNGGVHDGSATGGEVEWTVTVPAADENGPGVLVLTVVVQVVDPIPADVTEIGNVTYTPDDGPPDCDVDDPPPNCAPPLPTEPQVADSKELVDESGAIDGVAEAGEELTYEITLTNTGGTDAEDRVQIDQLDANVIFISADNGGVHDGSATGGEVEWTVTVPAADENGPGVLVLTVVVQVVDPIPDGVLAIGNVTYTPDDGPPDCDVDDPPPNCTEIPTEPNTRVEKSIIAESMEMDGIAEPGEVLTYSIRVRNFGGADAINVVVNEIVPEHTTYVADGSDAWSCPDGSGAGTACDFIIATVPGNGFVDLLFRVQVADPLPKGVTEIANSVALDGEDPPDCPPDTDPACSVIPTVPQTVVSKALTGESGDIDGQIEAGEVLTYTITVTNHGGSDDENVVVNEVVPDHTVTAAGNQNANGALGAWSCADGSGPGSACDLVLATVASGETIELTFMIQVDDPIPDGVEQIANCVALNGEVPPNPSPQCVTLPTEPSLSVVKTLFMEDGEIDGAAEAGEILVYELVVTNSGGSTAFDEFLREIVPQHTTFVADPVSSPGWDCPDNSPNPTVCDLFFDIDAGETLSFLFAVQVVDPLPDDVTRIANAIGLGGNPPPCPPAGVHCVVTPTVNQRTDKQVISVTPFGANAYRVLYEIVVTNTGGADVEYTLFDELGYPDNGVTLLDPALVETEDGVLEPDIAANGGQYTPVNNDPVQLSDIDVVLPAGESHTYTVAIRIAVNPGQVDDGECTGEPGNGLFNQAMTVGSVDTDDDACVPVPTDEPRISLVKRNRLIDANGNGYGDVGEDLEYTFEIFNSGNVDLSSLRLIDAKIRPPQGAWVKCDAPGTPGSGSYIFDDPLAPGGTITCTAHYTLSKNDVDNRRVTNTATVVGLAPDGRQVRASHTSIFENFQQGSREDGK